MNIFIPSNDMNSLKNDFSIILTQNFKNERDQFLSLNQVFLVM